MILGAGGCHNPITIVTAFQSETQRKRERHSPPEHTTGVGLLWQGSVVRVYLDLLLECSNPETLEGAAGTLQNLTASTWEPAQDSESETDSGCNRILQTTLSCLTPPPPPQPPTLSQILREAVRKEKGLSVISSLLRMANDSVVRSISVCLRNLALDPRNKGLLAENALDNLIKRLPGGEGANGITDLLLELWELGGVSRLLEVARCTDVYSAQCVYMANRVLGACWEQSKDIRKQLKNEGWNISMLQRVPPPDRTDGLEYDDSRNQFKASYNSGLNHRVQSPGRSMHSPVRGISPSRELF
eukprot:sb/3467345/